MAADVVNPWVDDAVPVAAPAVAVRGRGAEVMAPRWAAGAEVGPVAGLGTHLAAGDGGVWVVGAHGGAGTSTLALLLGAGDAGTSWPVPRSGSVRVLVAARTHAHGIGRAHDAGLQWAAGGLPGVELVGVVWVADAPGRLPRGVREPLRLASGAFPTSFHVPFVGAWRTASATADAVPRDVRRALRGLMPQDRED